MAPRADRYMARVEQHLWWLHDDAERFDFITSEMAKWEERRDAFIRKVDGGQDPGDVRIEDYTETLMALEVEQAKYSPLPRVDASGLQANVERLKQSVEVL